MDAYLQTITQSLVPWSIVTKFSGAQQNQLAQIGAFLREKREQQEKSLQDIANSTYIRPQLLSGIETGDPDLLPEPIFVQGFIRRYAETLGLKGVELSQQFTVDSIPATPRPAKTSKPEDSATTRLTRLTSSSSPQSAENRANSLNSVASEEVPIFANQVVSSTQQPTTAPTTAKSAPESDTPEASHLEPNFLESSPSEPAPAESTPEHSPLALDISEGIPVPPAAESANDEHVFDLTDSSNADISEPDASSSVESDLVESDLVENGASTNGASTNGASTNGASTNGTSTNGSGNELPMFEPTSAKSPSTDVETSTRQPTSDEASPFVSDLPLAKETPNSGPLITPPISYTSSTPSNSGPLGSDASNDTPNLKPFAIGAVIIAALTAGIVVLANVLGGEPDPTVADSPTPIESVEPEETEPALPELPEPEPAPPVSDAPLFLEVEVTAPAWTSVTADGDRLFEGTLNPGDRPVWEAQNSINVFSGNPGGLQISQNGQPAEALGESGIPADKDYSVQ